METAAIAAILLGCVSACAILNQKKQNKDKEN